MKWWDETPISNGASRKRRLWNTVRGRPAWLSRTHQDTSINYVWFAWSQDDNSKKEPFKSFRNDDDDGDDEPIKEVILLQYIVVLKAMHTGRTGKMICVAIRNMKRWTTRHESTVLL